MATEYYLQRSDKTCWDKVDEYTFANYQHAIKPDGSRRYGDNKITREENNICINANGLTQQDLSMVMRFLAVREFQGAVNGGIVQTPEIIKFKRGTSTFLHEMDGDNFRKS